MDQNQQNQNPYQPQENPPNQAPNQPTVIQPTVRRDSLEQDAREISANVPEPNLNPSLLDQVKSPKPDSNRPWKNSMLLFQLVVGAVLLAFFINQFVFQSYQVLGESMSPTLHNGDRLIVSKTSRSWNSLLRRDYIPARGEIIVFKSPINNSTQLVKRVVGLPGDRVLIRDGQVSIFNESNPAGFSPDDQFDADIPDITSGEVDLIVGIGEIFVIGDNRLPGGSSDSRNDLGLVPIDNIIGELSLRIFPLNEARFF